jgi:hypothetical protein
MNAIDPRKYPLPSSLIRFPCLMDAEFAGAFIDTNNQDMALGKSSLSTLLVLYTSRVERELLVFTWVARSATTTVCNNLAHRRVSSQFVKSLLGKELTGNLAGLKARALALVPAMKF